ncbi:MAG: hypothetical protein FWF10_00645 [Clostridiales bacterium]|nr:hypothetical protein [Clostridiales bacterium]
MAGICFPLDLTKYDAKALGAWLCTRTRGVFSADTDFKITAAGGMTITVDAGIAWMMKEQFWGTVVCEPNLQSFVLDVADGTLNRFDAVCLRIDKYTNDYETIIKSGGLSNSPEIPMPIQDDPYFEEIIVGAVLIEAGTMTVTQDKVFDTRLDETRCGVMRDGVTGIPTQGLHDSWNAWFTSIKEIVDDAINAAYDAADAANSNDLVVHNADPTAHPDIRLQIAYLEGMNSYLSARIALLEATISSGGNAFVADLIGLTNVNIDDGTWIIGALSAQG